MRGRDCAAPRNVVKYAPMAYFITSIPKSGTHLLATIVGDITGNYPQSVKKRTPGIPYGEYAQTTNLVGHFRAFNILSSESLAALFGERQTLILIRDPRAVCNSMVHQLMTSSNAYHREAWAQISALPFNEQVMKVARGIFARDGTLIVADLASICDGFHEITLLYEGAQLLRYESLFEPAFATERMPELFGIDAPSSRAVLERALAGPTRTKREGKPDGWRAAFDDELMGFFSSNYSELLERMGVAP